MKEKPNALQEAAARLLDRPQLGADPLVMGVGEFAAAETVAAPAASEQETDPNEPQPDTEAQELAASAGRPELYRVAVNPGNWTVTIDRAGIPVQFGLVEQAEGTALVRVDPLQLDEAEVWMEEAETSLQRWLCLAPCLGELTGRGWFRMRRSVAAVDDWQAVTVDQPCTNLELWVRDGKGRVGAAVRHPRGWAVWCGSVDPETIQAWAFMEEEGI